MVRLKLGTAICIFEYVFQFQFLNGSIKAKGSQYKLCVGMMFQFLNGSIKAVLFTKQLFNR